MVAPTEARGTANGSETAFLTDDSSCNIDVDGGQTILTSPAMDAVLTWSRVCTTPVGTTVFSDQWLVTTPSWSSLSSDNGDTWIVAEEIDSSNPEADGGWVDKVLRVADYVENTTTLRVRFTAQDPATVQLSVWWTSSLSKRNSANALMSGGLSDNSGSVDFPDLAVAAFPGDQVGCNTDLNDSGSVDFEDLLLVLRFRTCPDFLNHPCDHHLLFLRPEVWPSPHSVDWSTLTLPQKPTWPLAAT